MPKWTLAKFESSIEVSRWELPGKMTEPQVEEIVRRLVCRTLLEDDIISSSLLADDPERYIFLDRVVNPTIIEMGTYPYYVARLEA